MKYRNIPKFIIKRNMQEVTKINSKKEIFDIKMTLKLIKMNENAIDKSLLKIKKAANFDCFF